MQSTFRDQLVQPTQPSQLAMDPLRHTALRDPSASDTVDRDRQFLNMLQSFRPSGGVSRAQGVTDLLLSRCGQNVGTLARWIGRGEVVHFDWQHDTWLPMFQFDLADMTPNPSVGRVLKELAGVFDPWETAQWFASPSVALHGRTPANAVASDTESVLQAARCGRFFADA